MSVSPAIASSSDPVIDLEAGAIEPVTDSTAEVATAEGRNPASPWFDQFDQIVWPSADLDSCELPLESDLHLFQIILLLQCLQWAWRDHPNFYAAGNLTIYYSPNQKKSEYFRGPDFFVVLGVEPHPRKSWVVWNENGQYPHVIIELLSPSTAEIDRGEKKQIYQDIFRTPNYFWFDPQGGEELAGFQLVNGRYEAIAPNDRGWLWSEPLGLYLGCHEGRLRFFSAEGELLPTPEESALQAEAELARVQAEARSAEERWQLEQAKRQQLADKLRELGVDPDALG